MVKKLFLQIGYQAYKRFDQEFEASSLQLIHV